MKLSTKTYQKCRKPAFLFDRRAIANVLWAWPRGKSKRGENFSRASREIIISSPPLSQCLYPPLYYIYNILYYVIPDYNVMAHSE